MPYAFLSATTAGLLLGVLAGVVLIRLGWRSVECPRCGTINERGAVACSACDQPLPVVGR